MHVGCWKDHATSPPAIQNIEAKDDRLDKPYPLTEKPYVKEVDREDNIRKCYEVARDRGYNYFALRNGWCGSGSDAEHRYKMYGKSTSETECVGGEGGKTANDVYSIVNPKGKFLISPLYFPNGT